MEENNPIQQPTTPTPPEPKLHSFLTNKLFLITLVIVVLFIIVYAGIYLYIGSQLDKISKSSPTPLSTETQVLEGGPTANSDSIGANWKTYRNEEFGFEVKYPKDFKINTHETYLTVMLSDEYAFAEKQCNEAQSKLIEKGESFGPGPCLFGLFISSKRHDVLARLYDGMEKPYKPLSNVGAVELYREYGKPTLAVGVPRGSDKNMFILLEAYASYEKYGKELNTEAFTKELKIFHQILSTFQFTP